MTKLTIQVCQEHINRGFQRQCGACPIALAIGDALMAAGKVVVADSIRVTGLTATWAERWRAGTMHPVYCDLPNEARGFTRRFDLMGASSVRPFEFTLDVE